MQAHLSSLAKAVLIAALCLAVAGCGRRGDPEGPRLAAQPASQKKVVQPVDDTPFMLDPLL